MIGGMTDVVEIGDTQTAEDVEVAIVAMAIVEMIEDTMIEGEDNHGAKDN